MSSVRTFPKVDVPWCWVPTQAKADEEREREWTRRVATVIAVVTVVGLLPLGQVGGDIKVPDLSWIEPAHTSRYELTNGTESIAFNVTVTEETTDDALFEYWNNVSGERDTFEWAHLNKTRENLNFTGTYAFLFVNATDVESGDARIGGESYDRLSLDTVAEEVVFGDDNVTFTYDLVNGWLKEADDARSDATWTLLSVDTVDPNTIDDTEALVDNFCNLYTPPVNWDNIEIQKDPSSDASGAQSIAQICWEDRDCDNQRYTRAAATQIQWYEVLLFDHNWRHRLFIESETTDDINGSEEEIIPPLSHFTDQFQVFNPLTFVAVTQWHSLTNAGHTSIGANSEMTVLLHPVYPQYEAEVTTSFDC